jgi:hypothetical protein
VPHHMGPTPYTHEAGAARDASDWNICLASLEALLTGQPTEPYTSERHEALFTHYAKRFGPAAGLHKRPDM